MEDFKEYMKGKRVCLVGPSPSIIGSGKGEEIDSHDIIVRLNKSLPLPEKYKEDLGTRVDVLCNCMDNHPHCSGIVDPELWKSLGVKYVLAPFTQDGPTHMRVRQFSNKTEAVIPIVYNPKEVFNSDVRNLKASPTTGFSCLSHLLSLELGQLSIYGMDFYRNSTEDGLPYYKEYFQGRVNIDDAIEAVNKHMKEAKQNLGKQMQGHNLDSTIFIRTMITLLWMKVLKNT
jgi:hypothetical protein